MALQLHATVISYRGAGLMLLGESGSGKSSLAAEALVLGAQLVADDQARLDVHDDRLVATAPVRLSGILELRQLGLIRVPQPVAAQLLHLVVELVAQPTTRLPEMQWREYLGIRVPYFAVCARETLRIAPLLLMLEAVQNGCVVANDWRPEQAS